MRVLFDISHPAHVHFYKNMIKTLSSRGDSVCIIGRHKDVTTDLLLRYRLHYIAVGSSGRKSSLGHLRELLIRDFVMARVAFRFRPDIILTRGPVGAQVGRLLCIPSIFDTDDGKAVGTLFSLAAPFASIITTPDCIIETYGKKHIKYQGYKQTAYLHPNNFTANRGILKELGIEDGQRFFILRFVEMVASHDSGENGLSLEMKQTIINFLKYYGRVFVTQEGDCPNFMKEYIFPLSPDRLHDALAFSDLFIGDSQTMAAEAAVLGTPSLRLSSWAGRLAYLAEIQERYRLSFAYRPDQENEFWDHLVRWVSTDKLKESLACHHKQLLKEKIDVSKWYISLIDNVVASARDNFRKELG